MKTATLFLAAAGAALAFPGMDDTINEIRRRQGGYSTELIGDLVNLQEGGLSPTGGAIRGIIRGEENPEDFGATYAIVPERDSEECRADVCCIWKHIADEMQAMMVGTAGRCNDLARGAVRLGFHDAATWSRASGENGGATGSILLANECYDRPDNNGLTATCDQMWAWFEKYKGYGISMADLIQVAANVATVSCPLGPRIRTFVGRRDSSVASPGGLMPTPFDSADSLINLFAEKTISPADLVALIGAHTISQQRFVDPARAGDPQDSTPGVWDVAYYDETNNPEAPARVLKFQSDTNLAADSRTSGLWRSFTGAGPGQLAWNQAYARAYTRLSLLGVFNINQMTECTKALPAQFGLFTSPDALKLEEFAEGGRPEAVDEVTRGDVIED